MNSGPDNVSAENVELHFCIDKAVFWGKDNTMSSHGSDHKGQVSVQVWVDKVEHRKVKERLAREGKTMKGLITKFLRWYGGTEEQDDQEDQTAPEAR